MQARPVWLKVRTADVSLFIPIKKISDGQREALALALELKADVVLMDDKDAAAEAQRHRILTIPTFAILEQAAARNLIDLPKTVDAMRRAIFSPSTRRGNPGHAQARPAAERVLSAAIQLSHK